MKLITTQDLITITRNLGIRSLMQRTTHALEQALLRWQQFHKSPRHAIQYPQGVIEVMPCADDRFYACKYVNGHPGNTARGELSIVALGLLADVDNGYPLLIADMTLATALRTAATAALGASHLARPESRCLAIVGTGAQSEFQVEALATTLPLEEIRYFDIDARAMQKFHRNLETGAFQLIPCNSIEETLEGADVLVTATAARKHNQLITPAMLRPGMHVHALGGDCEGKTELAPELLKQCKIVVEFLPQSRQEGEIQNRPESNIHAELWELVQGRKTGRESATEITLFDSVGFALEDYAVLRLLHDISKETGIYHHIDLLPAPTDPKDLYGLIQSP